MGVRVNAEVFGLFAPLLPQHTRHGLDAQLPEEIRREAVVKNFQRALQELTCKKMNDGEDWRDNLSPRHGKIFTHA